jgi:hypothetical protein
MQPELTLKPPKANDGTVVMMLSLNLIILSFFILLNALANQSEEKARLASISANQGQLELPNAATEGLDNSYQNIIKWQNQTAEDVKGVLTNKVKLDVIGMEKNAEQLIVTLPLSSFFADGSIPMRDASLGVLQNILAVLEAGTASSILVQQPAEKMQLGISQSASMFKVFAAETGLSAVPVVPGWRLGPPALVLVLTPPKGPQGGQKLDKAVAPAAALGTMEAK